MRAGYQINLYGAKGWRTLTPNLSDLYWYLLDNFIELVRTKKESVPIEEEVKSSPCSKPANVRWPKDAK